MITLDFREWAKGMMDGVEWVVAFHVCWIAIAGYFIGSWLFG